MTSDDEIIARHIEGNPYYPGTEESRVVGYGVPVWALVGHLSVVNGNVERVANDYGLPLEAVQAALAYYQRHRNTIDARLAANEVAAA